MQKELKFIEINSVKISKKYRGEHIAIVGSKIVAHGKNLTKVEEKALKICKKPVFMEIPKEEIVVYYAHLSIYRDSNTKSR